MCWVLLTERVKHASNADIWGPSFSTRNQPPWLVKMSIRITCITSRSGRILSTVHRPTSGSATGTQRLLPASVRHSCTWLRIKAVCSRGHRKQNRVASLSFTARRSELNGLSRGLRNAVHYLTRVVPLRLHHCHPSRATERLGSLTSQQPPHRGPVLMPGPMRT